MRVGERMASNFPACGLQLRKLLPVHELLAFKCFAHKSWHDKCGCGNMAGIEDGKCGCVVVKVAVIKRESDDWLIAARIFHRDQYSDCKHREHQADPTIFFYAA